jgi:SAM-dependent methyltransferase/uncharacterized protein YbaR (Trm112 family)
MARSTIEPWYLENLVCPVDRSALTFEGGFLSSEAGRRYPVVEGMPVMLVKDLPETIGLAKASIELATESAAGTSPQDPLYLATIGASDDERRVAQRQFERGASFDAVVAALIGATSGTAYNHLRGAVGSYPIPRMRFPTPRPGRLLDVGCNWGRWTIAAAREGHQAVGIDPQLGAVLAARHVATQLGVSTKYVVADARLLPFREAQFDYAWSYSVLQHFADVNVTAALSELRRVIRPGGGARVQMANAAGLRNLYQIARKRRRPACGFDVRYRSRRELKKLFSVLSEELSFDPDCFLGLGLQYSDWSIMRSSGRVAVMLSESLVRASDVITPLVLLADSLFCTAIID